jgi:hypothetical protein
MIKMIAATPYNTRESLGWVIRNLTGFSRRNAGVVDRLKSPHVFNENVACRYSVTAVGDILPMLKNRLAMDARLVEFISGSDCIIGNFEGTITEKKSASWPIAFDQRHDASIAEDLAGMFRPDRTYLSVSNNHTGDFREEEFLKSVGILESAGFNVFGWNDRPFADINDDIRVIVGTMWSNRPFAGALKIDKAKDYLKQGACNIFCPHMGYELELYPRPEMAALAKNMAGSFDAVIAGHPHCPQPVTAHYAGGVNRIIAYSLGDFCTGLGVKTMQYGLVIRMDIGPDAAGRWAVGKALWQYTKCVRSSSGHFTVKPVSGPANPFVGD